MADKSSALGSNDGIDTAIGNMNAKSSTEVVASALGSGSAKRKRRKSSSRTRALAKRVSPGVVYISRVPPGLDVGIVRSILGRVGELGRVWLRAEAAEIVAERRSLGGRRRAGFADGWVEFLRADDAAAAVELLNGQPMTGATRRGRFQNDLWCLRLLPNFSWDDLVEEACGSRRERVLRVKREVSAARRERAFVEQRAALATSIERNEERRKAEAENSAQAEAEGGDAAVAKSRNGAPATSPIEERRMVRRYRQKRPISHGGGETNVGHPLADTHRKREGDLDLKERRALQRIEREEDGDCSIIDRDLVSKLFKRRRT